MDSTELTPEQVIALEKVDAFAVVVRAGETPLQGLSGRLDWRLCGLLTQLKNQGAFKGEAGECVLVPFQRRNVHLDMADKIYKILLIGSETKSVSSESLDALKKNIKTMGFKKIGLSKSDFGTAAAKFADSAPCELWMTN